MKAALGAVAILAALGAVAIPQQASAAICTIGTVASYKALGGTGCSVGNLTFANFAYGSTFGGSGAAVLDTNVVVVPIPQLNNNGLLFSAGGWHAFGGAFVDSTLFFTVTANKTVIEDATLAIAGGAVGTAFGNVGESILPLNLGLFATTTSPFQHITFAPTPQIEILKDILVAAAANNPGPNFASITAVLQEFSTPGVPELGTWAMMLIGFAGVGAQLRRRDRTITLTA